MPCPACTPILTKLVSWSHLEQILHSPASALSLMPRPCSPGLLETWHHTPAHPLTKNPNHPSIHNSNLILSKSLLLSQFFTNFLLNFYETCSHLVFIYISAREIQARTTLYMCKITSFTKPSIMARMQFTQYVCVN